MNKMTFNDFDRLNLKIFAENLFQIMEKGTNSPMVEEAYTISLNADFGNGKTTFLEMFKNFIKDKKSENYNVLFINAWKSDFSKEPVIAVLSEFINWMEEIDTKESEKNIITKETKNKILRVIGSIGNQAFKVGTGIDIKEIKKSYQEESIVGRNILKDFNQRKEAIGEIKEAIPKYIRNKKLLIIVDELDRTRPDYAVSFLEDMKHFFDIKNIVFLFAVNRNQLEETVKHLYGQGLKFDGYYRKFFKIEIDLPDPYEKAQNFIDEFIKKTNIKNNSDEKNQNLEKKEVYKLESSYFSCKIFQLTLREIELFLHFCEEILNLENEAPEDLDIYRDSFPFFVCLSMKRSEIFNKILDGSFGFNNLSIFFKDQNIDILFKERELKSGTESKTIHLILFMKIIISSFMTEKDESKVNGLIRNFVHTDSFEYYQRLLEESKNLFHQQENIIYKTIEEYKMIASKIARFSSSSDIEMPLASKICQHIKNAKPIDKAK